MPRAPAPFPIGGGIDGDGRAIGAPIVRGVCVLDGTIARRIAPSSCEPHTRRDRGRRTCLPASHRSRMPATIASDRRRRARHEAWARAVNGIGHERRQARIVCERFRMRHDVRRAIDAGMSTMPAHAIATARDGMRCRCDVEAMSKRCRSDADAMSHRDAHSRADIPAGAPRHNGRGAVRRGARRGRRRPAAAQPRAGTLTAPADTSADRPPRPCGESRNAASRDRRRCRPSRRSPAPSRPGRLP